VFPASCIVFFLLYSVWKHPLHILHVVFIDLKSSTQAPFTRGVLGGQQMPFATLAPHDLARPGHLQSLGGAPVRFQFNLCHAISPSE
jgi:hypothetical protein